MRRGLDQRDRVEAHCMCRVWCQVYVEEWDGVAGRFRDGTCLGYSDP